jgi:hypothetical protein
MAAPISATGSGKRIDFRTDYQHDWYVYAFLVSLGPHDYEVETWICSTTLSWCTLENIGCWGRHYYAPDKQGGYDEPAQNGDEPVLTDPLGFDDPIKVGVGTAAGLPPNAVAQITLPGHVFHNKVAERPQQRVTKCIENRMWKMTTYT